MVRAILTTEFTEDTEAISRVSLGPLIFDLGVVSATPFEGMRHYHCQGSLEAVWEYHFPPLAGGIKGGGEPQSGSSERLRRSTPLLTSPARGEELRSLTFQTTSKLDFVHLRKPFPL
jgi:hypothetical protein